MHRGKGESVGQTEAAAGIEVVSLIEAKWTIEPDGAETRTWG